MKLNVLRADPAGNITLFVLDPVEKSKRAGIAAQLMEIPEFKAEQVGFFCPPGEGADGHMEMMGGEFCGNATRAFGLLTAKNMGLTGPAHVRIETSGCDHIVTVDTDLTAGTSRAEMPLPVSVTRETVAGHTGTLVNLGGIAHFVVEGITPDQAFFDQAEPMLAALPGLDAYGVIFLEPAKGTMTPLVKVPATNTLVWEGSCGSGTLASAIAQSQDADDGLFVRDYIQPAGVVQASVARQGGKVTAAYIGGPVSLDEPVVVEL